MRTFKAVNTANGVYVAQSNVEAKRPECRMLTLKGATCPNYADTPKSREYLTELGVVVRICGMHTLDATNVRRA